MSKTPARSVFVIMLRAIGPATHAIMSMQQWRDAAEADGFAAPATYVATGNMIAEAEDTISGVARRMNRIVQDLGLLPSNLAVVRRARQLRRLLKANLFPDAVETRPGQVAVYFFAGHRPDFAWVADHDGPERVHVEGTHLIVDYGERTGGSVKLAGLIEKRSGPVTARNWNTLVGLAQRATARERH